MRALEPQIIQVKVQIHSCYCGLPLSAIPLPDNCVLLGIARNGEVVQCRDEPTIHCGDEILAAALHRGSAPALRLLLEKHHPIHWSSISSPWPRGAKSFFQGNYFHSNKRVFST